MTFEEVYKKYWAKVFRICLGYFNNRENAQDMTQETFIIVLLQLPKFRNESSIGTWIYRIASNNCLRSIEKEKRQMKGQQDIPTQAYFEECRVDEKVDFLYKCISELQEIERLIISLELENVKQSEIANILGISEANVRVRIHRIKKQLTNKFKSYEH